MISPNKCGFIKLRMKIIIGLGNPDEKYKRTYHNLGFIAAEDAAIEFGAPFSGKKCRAVVAETRAGGEKVLIAKPQTYMNLSGESVRALVDFYKVDPSDIIVIYDDYDLPKGSVRIRKSGSAGTHNGMRSIVERLGTENFPRIRIGFNGGENIPLIDYVLSGIKKEDYPLFAEAVHSAALAAVEFARGETIDNIMQKYNTKH